MNIEYLLKLKTDRNLTNEQIAELSGIPTSTLTRILNGRTDNPCFNAVVDIVRALDGSVDTMEHLCREDGECNGTPQDEIDSRVIDLYRETIETKDRWIRFLVWVLLAIGLFIIGMVIYDATQSTEGWIQY